LLRDGNRRGLSSRYQRRQGVFCAQATVNGSRCANLAIHRCTPKIEFTVAISV
jgi:hypothetical protein